MDITPHIYTAKVMHKRLFPKVNQFTYGVYYLALPLENLSDIHDLAINRPGIISFYEKDHANHDGSNLKVWIQEILAQHGLADLVKHNLLIAMPRILGYVFNPISLWLCLGEDKQLRAVLCEVHNTFGEAHSYFCCHEDHRIIESNDWLKAEKVFHVSPFLEREGSYTFRFSLKEHSLGVWIDYYDKEGNKQLLTSLTGDFHPLSKHGLRRVFWKYPLVTLKTISLIHYQAFKLILKGIKHITKPQQLAKTLSTTLNITKK